MNRHFGVALLIGANALVFGVTNTQAAANEALEEVVVTGSRVVKNGNDSPTPVTVINVADSEQVRPSTLADQLNDMPQFSGSRGQTSNNSAGSANNGNPNPQANVLNLRNFGVNRTLILFDGHRVAPTSPDGTVDVDMIPQMLIQRVDVVTGGASAVYGADAVSGVVNFITDTNFTGLKINGQAGRSVYNDDPTQAIGLAWGGDLFGGRGHLLTSYEYRNDEGVDRRSSRPFFANRAVVHPIQALTNASQSVYQLNFNVTNNDRAFGGLITAAAGQPTNPLVNTHFVSNGVLVPFNRGTPVFNTWSMGGDGAYFDTSLKASLEMHQIFGRLDYDFTDNLNGYVKFSGATNDNGAYSLTQPTYNAGSGNNVMTLFANNPYLPAAAITTMANAGVTRFNLTKTQADVPRQNAETFQRQYSVDTGFNLEFDNGYQWELALIKAGNRQKVRQNNAQDGLRLAAALDAVTVTAANVGSSGLAIGSIVCNVALTHPGRYPGCTPYNPFGPNSATAANIAYIFQPIEVVANTGMDDVETVLTGAPFNSWAGPVNMALSAQWRKMTYSLDSSTKVYSAADPLDCTGLRIITCTSSSQPWFQAASAPRSEVSTNVKEVALEFNLPLLADKPFAKDLAFNGAARYTNYSTSGTVTTWKAGLDWDVSDSLSFRGTQSRDIRAPTLFELFQPVIIGNFNGSDFLTGTSLNGSVVINGNPLLPATTFTQGNPKLTPEIGDTTTIGFVYRPTWASGLSIALDAYSISVTDAIATQNGNSQAAQLGCANSGGTSPFCQLIVRPISCCSTAPANSATALYQVGLNIAKAKTQGADLEVNYTGRVADMPFNTRLAVAYQPKNNTSAVGGGFTENAGFFGSAPIWRASLLASVSVTENFKVSVLERWRDSVTWVPKQSAPLPTLIATMPDISAVFYTNLNLSYSVKRGWGDTEIYFNIQNLFDREPPVSAAYNNTQPGIFGVVPGDDVIGRYYTVGFRYRM